MPYVFALAVSVVGFAVFVVLIIVLVAVTVVLVVSIVVYALHSCWLCLAFGLRLVCDRREGSPGNVLVAFLLIFIQLCFYIHHLGA